MADIKSVITITDEKAQYDEYAKKLLSMKPILAEILVHTVEEFSGMDPREVAGHLLYSQGTVFPAGPRFF